MDSKYTKKIILASIVFTILCVGGFYLKNQSDAINPINYTTKTYSDDYDLEKGLEDIARVAKPAVEAYLTQDRSESNRDRNARLSQYFSGGSPVYEYGLEHLDPTKNKISAKVKSIESTESEISYINLVVKTENTSYTSGDKNKSTHKYWLYMEKIFDGTYVAYDIGEL